MDEEILNAAHMIVGLLTEIRNQGVTREKIVLEQVAKEDARHEERVAHLQAYTQKLDDMVASHTRAEADRVAAFEQWQKEMQALTTGEKPPIN